MISNKKIKISLDKINAIKHSEEDAFCVFKDICLDLNLDQFALAIFSGRRNITESFDFYETYPIDWVKHYKKNQYHLYDPTFSALKKVAVPFEWNTESFDNLLPIQQALMNESYDFGIKSGVTVPLLPHPMFHGFVTALNKSALHYDVLYTLSLAGNVCVSKIMTLQKNNKQKNEIDIFCIESDKNTV
jgi:hypothetical protein